jgi:hypothetical protein
VPKQLSVKVIYVEYPTAYALILYQNDGQTDDRYVLSIRLSFLCNERLQSRVVYFHDYEIQCFSSIISVGINMD